MAKSSNLPEITPPDGPAITLSGKSAGLATVIGDSMAAQLTAKLQARGNKTEPPADPAPAAAAPEAPPAPPKPEPAKAAAPPPAEKPAAAPAAAAEPPKKPAAKEEPAEKDTPKQLREAYERAQARAQELEATAGATAKEKAEVFAKLAAAEAELQKHQKRIAEEFEPLKKVHEETARRLQEREEALRIRDYTATPEWHDNFEKPIVEVQQEALQFIKELVVSRDDGTVSEAGEKELTYIISAPNANEAAQRAEQLFGKQSVFTGQLVNYRTKLKALQIKRQEGLKNAQLASAKWQEQETLKRQQNLETLKRLVEAKEGGYLKDLNVGEDVEIQSALTEGRTLADRLTNGAPDMTPDSWADTVAQGRAAIQERAVLRKRLARALDEKKALETELTRFRNNEPAVQGRTDPKPAPRGQIDSAEAMKADVEAKLRARATRV